MKAAAPRVSPGSTVRGDRRVADNREAIVAAATRAIAAEGIRGFRVEDVAADAGVSTALLYYHFANRMGLVRAVLEHVSDGSPSTELRRRRLDSRGYEAIERALVGELGGRPATRDAAIVWSEVSASAVFDPELQREVQRVTEGWRTEVADAIRAGIDDGSIRRDCDPDAAADRLISLVDGLSARCLARSIGRRRAAAVMRDGLRRELGRS